MCIAIYKSIDIQKKLALYKDCIIQWNEYFSLVSKSLINSQINSKSQIWNHRFLTLEDHINNSLLLSTLIRDIYKQYAMQHHVSMMKIADIGSGSGLLAIPLIIDCETLPIEWVLIERNKKKGAFLKYCIAKLSLSNVQVFVKDANSYDHSYFDIVLSKAFGPLGNLLTISHKLLKPCGIGLLLKGEKGKEIKNPFIEKIKLNQYSMVLKYYNHETL